MEPLIEQLAQAKKDNDVLNSLVTAYLPFIKKEIEKTGVATLEYEDRVSLGMLVFVNCVLQYNEDRGGFLKFTSVCIRNRLVDEARKAGKGAIPLFLEEENATGRLVIEEQASLAEYSREMEQKELAEEIALLEEELQPFHIVFSDLVGCCPKQKRSRGQCLALAQWLMKQNSLKISFFESHRLPQGALAKQFGLSEKTVEKHRRYIVALCVILEGNYPGIRAFAIGGELN